MTVSADQRAAFDGFTDNIHLWWPLADHSSLGPDAYIGFEDGLLIEESYSGDKDLWATVRHWSPPSSLELSWHGGNPLSPTRVRVSFNAVTKAATEVRLTQDRRPSANEDGKVPENCVPWDSILARYARFMGGSADLD
ncbi:hypothetical protein IV498_10095 [Paenarthrobacter sp. Z7-10]|uniref:hypothetical protein n=1 Tax=Paenarthrobacter sp. Z7-10 TaxID=2787635 RepID=UPI0022A9B210|nr:hypothetical protein [Paenarthrobacter sp. Z7-10]MCZ2403522.1 hypothetical protein [Paenarthrobacter sp. Z7-10]